MKVQQASLPVLQYNCRFFLTRTSTSDNLNLGPSYAGGVVQQSILIILISFGLFLTNCSKPTKPEFKRNPNLTFLTRAHDPIGDEGFWECSFPVFSADGNKVYYIESRLEWWEFEGHKGDIWVIDGDGRNAKRVKEGDYVYLSISPDGKDLVSSIRNYKYSSPGGTLVLIDLNTLEEYIVPMPDTDAFVFGAEFTTDQTKLIYYAVFGYDSPTPEGFYSFDLADSSTKLLFGEDWKEYFGFDVHGDELATYSQIRKLDGTAGRALQMGGVWPEFSPDGKRLITITGIGAYIWGGDKMHMVDASTGELIGDLNVQTYELCTSAFPYWSPDGTKIVFASKPWGGDNQRGNFELWILNNVK